MHLVVHKIIIEFATGKLFVLQDEKIYPMMNCSYTVPDFHLDEKTKVILAGETCGNIHLTMKCKKSIWENVIPQSIPPQIDILKGKTFPVLVTCHTIIGNVWEFSPEAIGCPYIQFKCNDQKRKTGPLCRYEDKKERRWDHSLLMIATVGMTCQTNMKIITQLSSYGFTDKNTLATGEFVWPESLIGNDIKKSVNIDVKLSNEKGVLQLSVSRIREMSVFFRMELDILYYQ